MKDVFLTLCVVSTGLVGLALAIAKSGEDRPSLTFASVAWYFSVMFLAAFIGTYL